MVERCVPLLALLCCSRSPPVETTHDARAPAVTSASASAPVAPSVTADPTDLLELEAKSEWDKTQHVDIVYVPTPQKVVDEMLDVANVTSNDVVYDLGCGDGRIVVEAAKRGAKAIGFDIDPTRVAEARGHLTSRGFGMASIRWANVFSVDLSPATVVMLYLLPQLNVKLIPQLEKLRPGSRIVSHDFDMAGMKPDAELTVMASEFVSEGHSAYKGEGVPEDKAHYEERTHHIYVWTIPFHERSR